MSEQRSSLHVILFLGMASIGITMVLMMVSLDSLQQSAAGTRAKLANALMSEYKDKAGFENAVAEFSDGPRFRILQVSYQTRKYVKRDDVDKEMRDVAQFVYQESLKYEDRELYDTRQIAVKRTEVHGSGCFRSRTDHDFTLDLPERRRRAKDEK